MIASSVVMCVCLSESANATPVVSLVHLPAHHVIMGFELISGEDQFDYSLCKLSDLLLTSRVSTLWTSLNFVRSYRPASECLVAVRRFVLCAEAFIHTELLYLAFHFMRSHVTAHDRRGWTYSSEGR